MVPAIGETPEELELLEPQRRRRRRMRWALLAGCVLGAVWALSPRLGIHLRSWAGGQTDLRGRPRWSAPHPVNRDALAQIDLAAVHGSLLPAWMIAEAHGPDSE